LNSGTISELEAVAVAVREKYDTRQHKMIMDFLARNNGRYITAGMIVSALAGQAGQTTVYRTLDALVKEKAVIKVDLPEGKGAYYQYPKAPGGESGCHLLCTGCGEVADLDCSFISELDAHVRSEHHFKLDSMKTVLSGLCEKCG